MVLLPVGRALGEILTRAQQSSRASDAGFRFCRRFHFQAPFGKRFQTYLGVSAGQVAPAAEQVFGIDRRSAEGESESQRPGRVRDDLGLDKELFDSNCHICRPG